MSKCVECGSYAINHHCHGRDGNDPKLCDVCYWRKRASELEQARRTSEYWKASHLAGNAVIDRLEAEVEALRQFANEIISDTLAGASFDGGDIQEMAIQYGLLQSEQRNEPCGDVCNCSEFGFPVECFRKTKLLLGAASGEREGEK